MTRSRWVAHILTLAILDAASVRAVPQTSGVAANSGPKDDVLIFAALSVQTALDELVPAIEQRTHTRMRVSYAASSALAQQIANGAPAGLFISADLDWMNYLADRRLIKMETRVNLVGNTLVLIAPAASPIALTIAPGFPLLRALASGRLAIADPVSVPAGKYAKAALTSLGVWDAVSPRLAPGENVRAALLFVSRGEAPLGIVYRTDAMADRGVKIVGTFPAASHPAIVYPAALTLTDSPAAGRVLAFLQSPEARAVFRRQGFIVD